MRLYYFIIAILVLIIFLLGHLTYKRLDNFFNECPEYTGDLHTGDVIMARRNDLTLQGTPKRYFCLDLFRHSFTDFCCHTGIVIVINNIPYVYTAHEGRPRYCYIKKKFVKGSTVLIKAKNYIDEYEGNIFIYKYKGEIPPETYKKILKTVAKNHDVPYLTGFHNLVNVLVKLWKNPSDQNICSGVTVQILKILGVADPDAHESNMNIGDVRYFILKSGKYDGMYKIPNIYSRWYFGDDN